MTPTRSSYQSSLLKKTIPQMPEGYYSSGPNPNLAKFVEEHSTPYDPATDDYDVAPFDKPITTTKATAIYSMHTYWSKKPHDAIREYIQHYTKEGDLVLDPFCGSGGTALAALMEGRKAIAIDLSPAATFITKNYCTPVDVEELERAFKELEAAVKPEMDWLYETRCDRCDGRAMTNYTVWSYVFECPRCLEKVALFDCVETQLPKKSGGGTKKATVCPYCHAQGHLEEIKAGRTKRFDPVPVLVSYDCLDGCKPKKGERRHNDPHPKKREYFERYDLGKIAEIEAKEIPYWYPTNQFPKDFARWNSDLRLLGIEYVKDLYTKRNLWALAALFYQIGKYDYRDVFSFAFSGTNLHCSKMSHHKEGGGGIMTGTYYIPSMFKERKIIDVYGRKHTDIVNGKIEMNLSIKTAILNISTISATNLLLEENSLDYIFTDPPYSDTVQYGELNFVWESWLGFKTDWHENEIIVNSVRGKIESDWADLMIQAMQECYRVLKPGRWISLCYHDTSEGTWQLVQDIMAETGFISEESDNTLFIDAGQKSYNQYTAEKVTKRDLVINFRKPRPGETRAEVTLTGEEDERGFAEKARAILAEALEEQPGSSADVLYDRLVSRMVRKGEFERHNFNTLLRTVAEETPDHRWYLLETAGQVDEAEARKEEAAAARLESFLRGTLKANPAQEGVHYSDLFEQYLPVRDKPRRALAEWLPEYFFRTAEGTWRLPATEAEAEEKQELRASGGLRRIKRFTNALRNGVPPAAKDRPENAPTLADWINQCRRAGLHEQGKLLYEQGGLSFDGLPDEVQLEVEENYRICVRRLRAGEAESVTKKKPGQQQASLL